jgi:hypothetical protein
MSIKIKLWGKDVGYLNWNKQENCAVFKYDGDFIKEKLSISPIHLPLNKKELQIPQDSHTHKRNKNCSNPLYPDLRH